MIAKRRVFELLAFAGLLSLVGLILGLWFYTIAGVVVTLYIVGRLFAFRSVVELLDISVTRHTRSEIIDDYRIVKVGVDLQSNVNVSGTFTDFISDDFTLTGGANACERFLKTGKLDRIEYELKGPNLVHFLIPRSVFVAENDLFIHPVILPTDVSADGRSTKRQGAYEEAEAEEDTESWIKSREALGVRTEGRLGTGFEFSHLRPYETTDPPGAIHWKASAKLNRLVSKQFQDELDESLLEAGAPMAIVVDQSGSIGRDVVGRTGLDLAINVAKYFIQLAIVNDNKVSVVTYDANEVTAIAANESPQHVFQAITSLDETRSTPVILRPILRKPGMTKLETKRLEDYLAAPLPRDDDDGKRFREVVRYVLAHEEGYEQDLQRSPAFKAISGSVSPSPKRPTLLFISDVENDIDPVIEGVRLAHYSGANVYVVTIFSKLFERYDDPFVATEALYADYARYKMQVNKIASVSGTKVIEAISPQYLESALRQANVGAIAWGER
jgi:uncharacterized protein (DUF58 family)